MLTFSFVAAGFIALVAGLIYLMIHISDSPGIVRRVEWNDSASRAAP